MNKKLRSFYEEVMNCTFTKKECPQAEKKFSRGWVPRGFHHCKSKKTEILVVGKNPGHPLPGETGYYKGKSGEALLKAKEKWDSDKSTKTTYHKNIIRYLRYFLGLSEKLETYKDYKKMDETAHEKEISKYVAFTNLFKCSTKCEQETIKNNSFNICYKKYFTKEIELIRPISILALGKEVAQFLRKQHLPFIEIKHPSYFYRKTDEPEILKKIKKKLAKARKLNK